MTGFASLLSPVGNSSTPSDTAKFPPPSRRDAAAQPFSKTLDHAVHNSPERRGADAKLNRSRAEGGNDSGEARLRHEQRAPARPKSKVPTQREEEQSLAGACAVTSKPTQQEEPLQLGSAPQEVSEAGPSDTLPMPEGVSTITDETAQLTVKASRDGVAAEAQPVNAALLKAPPVVMGEPRATLELLPAPLELTPQVATTSTAGDSNIAKDETKTPNQAELVSPIGATDLAKKPEPVVTSALAVALETTIDSQPTDEADATGDRPEGAVATTAKEFTPPTDDARRVSRAARRAWAEALENARGIGGAKSMETMKTAIKKEEIAGLGQQFLPGTASGPGASLTNLPGEARLAGPAENSPVNTLLAATKMAPAPTRADPAGVSESLDLRATAAVTRTGELISREVRMFKRAGDDLVEVVLTPDAKTQISLRLQWREGQVEVQARCDLGDHHALNQHWTQLQASMAQHGVRLSHLNERTPTGFTEFFSNPGFSQHSGGERRSAAHPHGAEPLPAPVTPAGKSGAAKSGARGSRLLESWA
jgi:hypothetical protein